MIYVLTENRGQYEGFLHEFRLRTHYGHGKNQDGQVQWISDGYELRGVSREALILLWGTPERRRDYAEMMDRCQILDIPVVRVPDLKRERYMREQMATRPMRGSW